MAQNVSTKFTDNYELKDLCLYLDEERNCIDLNCPHCGEKILSRPNSVVPPDEDEAVSRRLMDHKSNFIIGFVLRCSNFGKTLELAWHWI